MKQGQLYFQFSKCFRNAVSRSITKWQESILVVPCFTHKSIWIKELSICKVGLITMYGPRDRKTQKVILFVPLPDLNDTYHVGIIIISPVGNQTCTGRFNRLENGILTFFHMHPISVILSPQYRIPNTGSLIKGSRWIQAKTLMKDCRQVFKPWQCIKSDQFERIIFRFS